MGVVINEFEVLPAAPPAPANKANDGKDNADRDKLESSAVCAVLRQLEVHSLRSWAH